METPAAILLEWPSGGPEALHDNRTESASERHGPGTQVEHPTRGCGIVVAVDKDNERGRPYLIAFKKGETAHDKYFFTDR